jgi:HPt (histidine-containing phosphotransfer) domain-containing protein
MSVTEHGRPVLDPEALEELRACDEGGDGSLIAELIDIYLEDTPRRLAMLRMAFDAADPAALAREAHALKGSCSQFGATTLAECCRKLEQLGRQGSLAGVEELLASVGAEYPRVQAALAVERTR